MKEKRKASALQSRLFEQAQLRSQQALSRERVLQVAMQQHLLSLHDSTDATCFYTAPGTCLALQSVESVLREPATKKRHVQDQAGAEVPAPDLGVQVDVLRGLTFQIIFKNAADKKVIRPTVGAGGRLSKGCVVVAHAALSSADALLSDTTLVSRSSSAVENLSGQYLLSNFLGDVEELQTSMRTWNGVDLAWTFRSMHALGFEHGQLHDLLHAMVSAGAFESQPNSLGYTPLPEQEASLQSLKSGGLAIDKGREDVRWFLTDAGAKDLSSCARLSSPAQVFAMPENLCLEDATTYQLIMALQQDVWCWRP